MTGTTVAAPRPTHMLAITAAWGSCFIAIDWGLRDAPVLWFAAFRSLLGGTAFFAVACRQHRPRPRGATAWSQIGLLPARWLFGEQPGHRGSALAFLALIGTAGAFVLWFIEVQRAPLAAVALWTFRTPVFGLFPSGTTGSAPQRRWRKKPARVVPQPASGTRRQESGRVAARCSMGRPDSRHADIPPRSSTMFVYPRSASVRAAMDDMFPDLQ